MDKERNQEIWKKIVQVIILNAAGFGSWAWLILKGLFESKKKS